MTNLILDPTSATFEDFGDEIVIIHNASGVFYSLTGRAMAVWRGLAEGLDPGFVDARLREIAAVDADTVRAMLAEFTERGIVVPFERATVEPATLDLADLGPARFDSNSDFDDLIRLDPIHDVSDDGWPHRKTDPR
jgi:hypothetical protein